MADHIPNSARASGTGAGGGGRGQAILSLGLMQPPITFAKHQYSLENVTLNYR
jgi:hypothetical protein